MIDDTDGAAAADDSTAADLDALVALLADHERTGEGAARRGFVDGWKQLRPRLAIHAPDLLAARAVDTALLDLAVVRADLVDAPAQAGTDPELRTRLEAARDAARDAGLPVEALRAELDLFGRDAVERAAAGSDTVGPDLAHVTAIVAALAAQAAQADPATADVVTASAMSRAADVVLDVARTLDAAVSEPEATGTALRAGVQAAQEAVEAFEAVDAAALTPAAAAAYARALGVGPFDDAAAGVARLESALTLLPAGTRAGDRAELLRDLSRQLVDAGDGDRAVGTLAEATEAFRLAGDDMRAAACESFAATLLSRLGRHGEAADLLARTVGAVSTGGPDGAPADVVLGLHAEHLTALARADRADEAAGAARSVLALLDERPAGHPETAFPAGRAAYAAAVALRAAGERDEARAAAERSAALHGEHLDGLARAEALELAAALADTPAQAAALLAEASTYADGSGYLPAATELRRRWAAAAGAAEGPDAALAVLDETRTRLEAADGSGPADDEDGSDDEQLRALHVALVDHQRASTLLAAGRPAEAVAALENVAQTYGDVGDHDNAVRAICLLVEALHLSGRTGDAVTVGRGVADQLAAAGGAEHARAVGGVLAAVLEAAGDVEGARAAWAQYGGSDDGSDDGSGTGGAPTT